MNYSQKGSSTTELMIYLTVSSFLLILLYKAVCVPLFHYVEEEKVKVTVDSIVYAVKKELSLDLHKNGYDKVNTNITVDSLIAKGFLTADEAKESGWKYRLIINSESHSGTKMALRPVRIKWRTKIALRPVSINWKIPLSIQVIAQPDDPQLFNDLHFDTSIGTSGDKAFMFLTTLNLSNINSNWNYFSGKEGGYHHFG